MNKNKIKQHDLQDNDWIYCTLCKRLFQVKDLIHNTEDNLIACAFKDCDGIELNFNLLIWSELLSIKDKKFNRSLYKRRQYPKICDLYKGMFWQQYPNPRWFFKLYLSIRNFPEWYTMRKELKRESRLTEREKKLKRCQNIENRIVKFKSMNAPSIILDYEISKLNNLRAIINRKDINFIPSNNTERN